MAIWELTTEYKKSSVEIQIWFKDGNIVIREEGYRWGTFTVESDTMPLTQTELIENDEYELSCIENDNCWEMQSLDDGCWGEIRKGHTCSDEALNEFELAWEEDSYSGVEEKGWYLEETEYYMTGPLKLVNLDTGKEYSGLVDPTTIVHTIDLPLTREELAQMSQEMEAEVRAEQAQGAKWPFMPPGAVPEEPEMTDWFPVSTKPAYKGFYEVLTKESINWPYPNKAEWTGKKWVFLDHTVTDWRGLAKDPNA